MAYNQNDNNEEWDRWDSNASNSSYYNQPTHKPYGQAFITASLVCGFLSMTLSCAIPFVVSALGILFALLTYRKGKKMVHAARMGLTLCIIGFAFQFVVITVNVVSLLRDPEKYENTYRQYFEENTGIDYDRLLENFQKSFPHTGQE